MLYDVQLWKFPGVITDTVTSSKRYAIERCEILNSRTKHQRAIILDQHGRVVTYDS